MNREVLDVRDMRDREPARQPLQDSQPPLGRRAARPEFDGGRGRLYAAGLFGDLAIGTPGLRIGDGENVT